MTTAPITFTLPDGWVLDPESPALLAGVFAVAHRPADGPFTPTLTVETFELADDDTLVDVADGTVVRARTFATDVVLRGRTDHEAEHTAGLTQGLSMSVLADGDLLPLGQVSCLLELRDTADAEQRCGYGFVLTALQTEVADLLPDLRALVASVRAA